jgi:L-ascorbate 6-phosphate lactonase
MATYSGDALVDQINRLVVPPGSLAIWGLGQMGVALKGGTDIVYIDPCLSNVVAERVPELADQFQRAYPPPLHPAQVTNAAYVLCSHEHLDHADPLTLGPIADASPQARFVISGWAHGALDEARIDPSRRVVPEVDVPFAIGNLRLTAIPSAHYTLEHDAQRGHRWLGFLIEWNGVTFYHSGDTIIYDGYVERLRRLPRADVAMVAVNGRDAYRDSFGVVGNLLPAEAAWLATALGWDMLLGGHNDLFAWNALPAGDLAEAIQRHNPRQKHHALQPGELLMYIR